MNLVEQKKLTVMQKIMKKIYIMFANEKSIYSFPNLPVWLKNDEDVGKKLLEKCNHILSEEEILISESPVIAQLIDKKKLRSIIVKRTDCYEYSALLPKEMQEKLPESVIINCPQDVILTFFSGNKEKEKKKIDFSKLDKETQFKIASIDNRYLKEMPKDTQLEYVGSNVLLRDILSEELQPEIFGENKDLKLLYGEIVDNISEEEYDTWKNYSNFYPYSIYKDVINKKSPKLLLELLKYGDFNIINMIGGKYNNQILNSLIDEIKKEISDSENGGKLTTFLDEIYGRFENEDSAENIQRLLLFIKVALNKDILENVEPEEIIDYLNTPSREKLLKIVEIVFSNEAKTILEERPRLDIKNIPNLYIFNKEIMNEFSFGDIHNFLSYNNKGVKIITDLVRYPEKMQSYKVFSKITSQYFANTPQDLEKKLLAFSFFNELAFELCNNKGNLSEKCIKNLHLMLDDFSTDRFKILPVKVKSIEELESYDKTREKMVDDAIKKLTDIELVKEIILQCYFNPADMCKKEELTRFRTFLSKEEIDYLEKRFEIKNMNDLDSLKKEYENLKEKKEDFIKKRMSKIGNKIKKHYDELMVSSLLLPEDAAKRAKMGEPGISMVEEDGLEIITLSGADVYLYISNLEAGHMSQNPVTTTIDDQYKRWTELEEGTSTISGCIFGKYNFKHIWDYTGNYWVGFSDFSADQIVSFGRDDINTAHEKKCLKPAAESTDSRNTPKEITKKANYNKNGPELAIFRRKKDSRSIKKGTYGGRIMPTYVFATKEDYTEQKVTYISRAKDFGVKYIIVLDKEAYKDIDKSIDYDTEKE